MMRWEIVRPGGDGSARFVAAEKICRRTVLAVGVVVGAGDTPPSDYRFDDGGFVL